MRGFRTAAVLLLVLLFLTLPAVAVKGEQQQGLFFSLDCGSAESGSLVNVSLRAVDTDPSIAGFRVRIEYDGSAFEYDGSKVEPQVESGTLQVNGTDDPVTAVYVCNVGKGYAPELSGTVATFRFRVKQNVAAGAATFDCRVDQICDFDGNALDFGRSDSLSLDLADSAASDPRLTALAPSQGTLNPSFSPDVFQYVLCVNSSVDSVTFQADAADGETVKVSRKSLLAAGTDTPVTVTVTSTDKKIKKQYYITVRRAEETEKKKSAEKSADAVSKKYKKTAGKGSAVQSRQRDRTGEKAALSSGLRNGDPENVAVTAAGAGRIDRQADGWQQTDTTLYLVRNRFPSYVAGMLAAALCAAAWVLLYRRRAGRRE